MSNMQDVKVLITTRNEEDNLPVCLSAASFVDEIWVVDSFSTDRTPEIARDAGATLLQREYISPSDQKNWALDKMGEGWILILDADERVTDELREEMNRVLEDPKFESYWIPRRNYFLGKLMKHAGWERDGVVRLIHGKDHRYGEALVHEKMLSNGPVGRLEHPLEHHSYRHLPDYLERMMRYSLSGGRQMHERGERSSFLRVLLRPGARFMKMFFLQRGLLDGAHGFLLCIISAFQVGLKHAVHWGLDHRIGNWTDE